MLRVKTPALQKFAVPGRCVGCGDTNVERAGGLEQTCSGSYSSFGTVYSLDVGVRFRMCWPCQLARNKEDRQGTAGCVAAAAVIAVAGSTAYQPVDKATFGD